MVILEDINKNFMQVLTQANAVMVNMMKKQIFKGETRDGRIRKQ